MTFSTSAKWGLLLINSTYIYDGYYLSLIFGRQEEILYALSSYQNYNYLVSMINATNGQVYWQYGFNSNLHEVEYSNIAFKEIDSNQDFIVF